MKKFEEEMKEWFGSPTGFNLEFQSGYEAYCALIKRFKDWVSPEAHQAEIEKIELQNLKYREEIARMQKALRKKNKAIKELNGAVKKTKARLKECEKLRIEANNEAASEYSRKCEVVEERAEFKREIEKLKPQLEKQQPEIPEFMAEWIKYWKSSGRGVVSIGRALTQGDNLSDFDKIHSWLSEYYKKYDEKGNEIIEDRNGVEPPNVTLFTHAWLYGYTVAKEKRFYLKNKLTGQRLIRLLEENGGGFLDCVTSTDKERMQFTQQEIDSMAADSYEQIEVEE